MLRRKLQDWMSTFSAYHDRLKLADLSAGMEVMVMHRVNFWGKTSYEFTGVIVSATEDVVFIRDPQRSPSGLGQGIAVPAVELGLIDNHESITFVLRPTLQNRLNHVYL
jgi:hypothetical protein